MQVNPDEIDITKVPELPAVSQEEEDVYRFLYEDALLSAGYKLATFKL